MSIGENYERNITPIRSNISRLSRATIFAATAASFNWTRQSRQRSDLRRNLVEDDPLFWQSDAFDEFARVELGIDHLGVGRCMTEESLNYVHGRVVVQMFPRLN
jgi:hypothetical protein